MYVSTSVFASNRQPTVVEAAPVGAGISIRMTPEFYIQMSYDEARQIAEQITVILEAEGATQP